MVLPNELTIEDIIPHRDGMLLIDEVISVGDNEAVTRSTVAPRWPLTDEQGAQSIVLLELAAQTAGINNGLQLRQEEGPDGGRKGWIVGIKSAQFHISRIPLNTPITVRSQNRFEYEGFCEIYSEATIAGQLVAEITMQLVKADAEALAVGDS